MIGNGNIEVKSSPLSPHRSATEVVRKNSVLCRRSEDLGYNLPNERSLLLRKIFLTITIHLSLIHI